MPRSITLYRVFVASPSDVADEREAIEEVIRELNLSAVEAQGAQLQLLKWETHAFPDFGTDVQDVVNRQIGDDYDIFLGVMWTRFGTPTSRAGSGTAEEFERAFARYQRDRDALRLMLYFKDAPLEPSKLDLQQLGEVRQFQERVGNLGGLYWKFKDRSELEKLLRLQLTRVLRELSGRQSISASSVPTPPDGSDDELGIYDYSERLAASVQQVTKVVELIGQANVTLGDRTRARAADLEKLASRAPNIDAREVKQITDAAAEDMEAFACTVGPLVPALSENFKSVYQWFEGMLTLTTDFSPPTEADVAAVEGMLDLMIGAIIEAKGAMGSLSNTVVSLPRMSREFNSARRKISAVLTRLDSVLEQNITIAQEMRTGAGRFRRA